MLKPSKKWFALLVSAGIITSLLGTNSVGAEEAIYDCSAISITSAVDRYIASNQEISDIIQIGSIDREMLGSANPTDIADETNEATMTVSTEFKYPMFEGKAIVTADSNVNIRVAADPESEKVGSIARGGVMIVEELGGEWSLVASGNCKGYIKNEFIAFGDAAGQFADANLGKKATITAGTLRVRTAESEDADIVTLVPGGESYSVISQGDKWTYIEIDGTSSGYVSNEFIDISYNTVRAKTVAETEAEQTPVVETTNNEQSAPATTETPANEAPAVTEQATEAPAPATEAPVTEAPPAPSAAGFADVTSYAVQFVGNSYVYGGSSLTGGTDCSGFTMRVYEQFGYSLPHSSRSQANCGTEVALTNVAPGDLIFYNNGGSSIGHVALYIGNGQVVHAKSSSTGITIDNMYYSTPCKATRIVN